MDNNPCLESALDYAQKGMRVIPVPVGGKKPAITGWPSRATTDERVIYDWWKKWPQHNVGVVWGEATGLVDIEWDSEDEKKLLLDIFGGELPPTAQTRSKRGGHLIMKWRPELPGGAVYHHTVGDTTLLCRFGNGGLGAYSLMPPSVHSDGKYEWVLDLDEYPPMEINNAALARLMGKDDLEPEYSPSPGVAREVLLHESIPEGQRDDRLFRFACRVAGRSPNIDDPEEQADLLEMLAVFNEAKCKPPLDDKQIIKIRDSAIKYARQGNEKKVEKTLNERFSEHGLGYTEDGQWLPGEWQHKTIDSDPIEYVLHVPKWIEKTADNTGSVRLSVEEYRSPAKIAAKVQGLTNVVLDDIPGVWPAIWNGHKGDAQRNIPPRRGLKALLLDHTERIEAPPEEIREAVVAQHLLRQFGRVGASKGEVVPKGAKIHTYDNGEVVFQFLGVYEELRYAADEIKRNELSQLCTKVGVSNERINQDRYKRLSLPSLENLRQIARL